MIEARGRPLTAGFFGGVTAFGVEEISGEPSTVDHSPTVRAVGESLEPRPEFDVTVAFNAESVPISVNRAEGITFAVVAPCAVTGGTILAGQGAVARLDGRIEAFPAPGRTLFVNLGPEATSGSGMSRAAQFMLLDQAVREARPPATARDGDFQLLTPNGREVLARYLAGGRIAFSVDRTTDIRQVLAFAKRNGARTVIIGGAQAAQVASLLATRNSRFKVPEFKGCKCLIASFFTEYLSGISVVSYL